MSQRKDGGTRLDFSGRLRSSFRVPTDHDVPSTTVQATFVCTAALGCLPDIIQPASIFFCTDLYIPIGYLVLGKTVHFWKAANVIYDAESLVVRAANLRGIYGSAENSKHGIVTEYAVP